MTEKHLDVSRVKTLFEEAGIPIAEWARLQGFSTALVYSVLEGNRKCFRGQSHRIALALGLKNGVAMDIERLSELLKTGGEVG